MGVQGGVARGGGQGGEGQGGGDGGEGLYGSVAYHLYQINHHDKGQAGEEATLDIPFVGVR